MNARSRLTRPASVADLHGRIRDDGWVEVHGHATFEGERVRIGRVLPSGLVSVEGPISLREIPGFTADLQTGGTFGDVDFAALERFWLVRTTHHDGVDGLSPLPGLSTVVAGIEFGVADTCGTVSIDGVRQIQLIWRGSGEPDGAEWIRDGYGCWTSLIERSRVEDVRYVEWKAIWRDITVFVAGLHDGRAHIFVTAGGAPEFEAPEIKLTGSMNSCWSAEVPVEELSLRSWRSEERPVGSGVVAGEVGFVRGRTTVLTRSLAADGTENGFAAIKNRGQTVSADYIMHPMVEGSVDSPVEWMARVSESDIADLRRISSTTVWKSEVTSVDGVDDAEGTVFFARVEAAQPETSELVCAAQSIAPKDLPTGTLALAGSYVYSELRP